MADELYQPYAWKSARSSARTSTVDNMAAAGREPALNVSGKVRGFRTRPGAPISDRDTMTGLGIAGQPGRSAERDNAWDAFFRKPTIPPTGSAPPAVQPAAPNPDSSMGSDETTLATFRDLAPVSTPQTPAEHVSASIAANTDWMSRQGIQVPPPAAPAPIQSGWNVTTPAQTQQIALRYTPPPATVKNPWGKPIPLS